MQTIAIVSQKGGAGKTTLAVNLAAEAARSRVSLIIDTDPQATASRWGQWRGGDDPEVIDCGAPTLLAGKLAKAAQLGADLAVIDTPPHADAMARQAARLADLLLIPCRPRAFDPGDPPDPSVGRLVTEERPVAAVMLKHEQSDQEGSGGHGENRAGPPPTVVRGDEPQGPERGQRPDRGPQFEDAAAVVGLLIKRERLAQMSRIFGDGHAHLKCPAWPQTEAAGESKINPVAASSRCAGIARRKAVPRPQPR